MRYNHLFALLRCFSSGFFFIRHHRCWLKLKLYTISSLLHLGWLIHSFYRVEYVPCTTHTQTRTHTHDIQSELDIFATFRKFPLTLSYGSATLSRKIDKSVLDINGGYPFMGYALANGAKPSERPREFVFTVYVFNTLQNELAVNTYPMEFFRRSFEHLIHLCRQAKL